MQEIEDQKTSVMSNTLADEMTPQEGLEYRLARYAKAKARSESVQGYIISLIYAYPQEGNSHYNKAEFNGLKKLRDQLKECGSFLMFRHYHTVGLHKLVGGCTCKKHLLCMLCAVRRASKQLSGYLKKVDQVMKDNPGRKLILITLTVKNGDDLRERFQHLTKSLKVLTDRRRFILAGKKPIHTVFTGISGAVWTFETTNNGKGWHPHCHMLALVDQELNVDQFQESLTKEWTEISGDSYIVDARTVLIDNDNRIGAFCEVFKYALKTNDMSLENQYKAYRSLSGKRLIASLGSLYGVKISDDLNDDIEEELELLPYVDILFRYSKFFGYQEHENYTPSSSLALSLK